MDIRVWVILSSVICFLLAVGLFAVFYRLRTLLKVQLNIFDLVQDIFLWSGITFKELTEIGKLETKELKSNLAEWLKSDKVKKAKVG